MYKRPKELEEGKYPKMSVSKLERVEKKKKGIGIKNILRLIASILICEAVGGIGSLFTINSISTWYGTIAKPSFTPPNWLFGPVWITLFLLMGVSVYLLWTDHLEGKSTGFALTIFGIQLGLNALWSYLFFGLQLFFAGFVEILVLWAAIAMTIVAAYRVNKTAGLILLPYIAWVTIATLLTYYIWILNP